MQIGELVINRLSRVQSSNPVIVGICGRAGSGKSTLAAKLSTYFRQRGIASTVYSGDWRFHLDSSARKNWIAQKWRSGFESYVYALNQHSWWDFKAISRDLEDLVAGKQVTIADAYDRQTGKRDETLELEPLSSGVVLYENCILGSVEILDRMSLMLLVNTPDDVCFERLFNKDRARRSCSEFASRYLMTTFSENLFLRVILDRYARKTIPCDSDGYLSVFPELCPVSYIPVPLADHHTSSRPVSGSQVGTVFLDLDGTLVRHVPIPSHTGEEIEILDGSVEKVEELRRKGYRIVLTTSRPQDKTFRIIDVLREKGLTFDQVICDLPVGPRHLVNDSKNGEVRAFAHPLERDAGVRGLAI